MTPSTSNDLLSRLKSGAAAVGTVTVEGVTFGLRLLTEQDYLEAQIATESAMKEAEMALSVSTAESFEAEKASQLLARALVDPDTGKPVAASAKVLRQAISRDQKMMLIDAYLDHEKAFSPSERTLSDADLAALLDTLKKTPETTVLNGLSTTTLKRLITCSVCPPAN